MQDTGKNKTVLLVSNVSAGLINFRYELIESLVKENRVVLLAANTGRVEECLDMGCEFCELSMDARGINPFSELKLTKKYKREIERINPDIVLTYTIKPNVYVGMVCASLGIPYIATITGLGTAVEKTGLIQLVTLPLYKYGLRKANKVFFQNQENMDFMKKKRIIKGCPYELVPGSGVNIKKFPLLDYPKGETIDFVFISRILKEKGIDEYLEAAKIIRKKHPKTRFHVCGNCDKDYEYILNRYNDEGIIIYHGRISDIVGMHSISSCTIHPTYYPEGMSNVLLESSSCGRPIITTNRAGCKEIIDDGINGFLVNQRDSKDLVKKIETFLNLPWEERRQMGIEGRKKIEREFDRDIVIQKYLEEIEK